MWSDGLEPEPGDGSQRVQHVLSIREVLGSIPAQIKPDVQGLRVFVCFKREWLV